MGAGLSAVFFVSAYFIYVHAVMSKDKFFLLISILLYFLPILIETIEDLEFSKKTKLELGYSMAVIVFGMVFLVLILYYAFLYKESDVVLSEGLRMAAIGIPALFVIKKSYPFFVKLYQVCNRQKYSAK